MSSHAEREAKDNLWIKSEQNSRFRHIFPKLHIVYMVGGYPQGPPPPPPPQMKPCTHSTNMFMLGGQGCPRQPFLWVDICKGLYQHVYVVVRAVPECRVRGSNNRVGFIVVRVNWKRVA